MNILLLDNYDSFTYNLVQYVEEELDQKVDVFRNDKISLDDVAKYDLIILSPGPGVPKNAGIMPALIERYAGEKVIFGVCLGHQAIGEAFGASLLNLDQVHHGIETPMRRTVTDDPLFAGVPETFNAGRYHSWVIDPATLPEELEVTATGLNPDVPSIATQPDGTSGSGSAEYGGIMAMQHREYPIFGVQFHPESIMTEHGRLMIKNLIAFTQDRLAVPA